MFTKLANWFKSIIVESKAITWPNKNRVYTDSMIVVVSLVIATAALGGIDYLLFELFKTIISKIG